MKIISSIYILILVFLFVSNASKSAAVINAIGGQSSKLITVLQGR